MWECRLDALEEREALCLVEDFGTLLELRLVPTIVVNATSRRSKSSSEVFFFGC